MTDKEKIRALIERRRKEWRYGSSIEAKYKSEECDDILSQIDSMQKEPVGEDLDVGKGEKNRSTKENCLGCDRLRIVDFKKTDGEIVQVYMCVGLLDVPCPKGYG